MNQQNIRWRIGGPPSGLGGGVQLGRGPIFGGGHGRRRRGDVRAALLLLLADEPRNGYQLMQAIEELSDGRWRPSPGSIYPTLAQLEDEGLIRAKEREGPKLFEITDAGREHVEEHGHGVPPWASDEEPKALTALRGEVKQLHIAAVQVAHAGHEDQVARAAKTLASARRDIYRILGEADHD